MDDAYTTDNSVLPLQGQQCPRCGGYLVPPMLWHSVVPLHMCSCMHPNHCPCHVHTFSPQRYWPSTITVSA